MKRIEPTPEFAARYRISRPFILTVGVLEPRKNQVMLLEVLRELRAKGHDLELIIIGRPGWRWTDPTATESISRPEAMGANPDRCFGSSI